MENKDDIVIVSAVRTPFSRFDSAMADISSIDLAVMVMEEVVKRVGVKPEEVDEINYGSCVMAEMALERIFLLVRLPCWRGSRRRFCLSPWTAHAAPR